MHSSFQTSGNSLFSQPGLVRGIVKGDGESPFMFYPCKTGTFRKFPFLLLSSFRPRVESLRGVLMHSSFLLQFFSAAIIIIDTIKRGR